MRKNILLKIVLFKNLIICLTGLKTKTEIMNNYLFRSTTRNFIRESNNYVFGQIRLTSLQVIFSRKYIYAELKLEVKY